MYLYMIYIIILISFSVAVIYNYKRNKRIRRDKEILSIGKNRTISVNNILYIVLILLYLAIIIFKARSVLRSFNIYFTDIFQLFNIRYIESLMDYFTDEVMLVPLIEMSSYRKILFSSYIYLSLLIIISLQMIYLGSRENIIYEDGIMIEGRLWKWKTFTEFGWDEKNNCKLILSYESKLTLTKLHIKVRVKHEDREKINEVLSRYLIACEQTK